MRVGNSATVRAFTIVPRAAPGIPAPYVLAIVTTESQGGEAIGFGSQPVWTRSTAPT